MTELVSLLSLLRKFGLDEAQIEAIEQRILDLLETARFDGMRYAHGENREDT